MKIASILLLGLGLFFSSCETETQTEFLLDNQSSRDVSVSGYDFFWSDSLQIEVPAGEEVLISRWDVRGLLSEPSGPDQQFRTSLNIVSRSGELFLKDPNDLSLWGSTFKDHGRTHAYTYVLLVSDSDF